MESDSSDDMDPCTGFPTTNKAKLSIPSISWSKHGARGSRGSLSMVSSTPPPLNPIDLEIQTRVSPPRFTGWKRYIGLLLTVLSAITFSFNALIAKLLNHFHPFNLGIWTFSLMTLFALPTILYEVKIKRNGSTLQEIFSLRPGENGKVFVFLFIRAVCGVSALIFFFYAMKYLNVADALVIDASSPIFVFIMAFLFLGEKCGLVPILTTALAFVGVTLIARPPFLTGESQYDINSLIGAMLALACMLCITITIITLKFLDNVFHGVVNFAFGLWGVVQCLTISLILGAISFPTEWSDILKIFATAVLFYLGQAFITLALKYENASAVGLLRTTEVMFAFIWQFLFLGVSPDAYSCSGAVLIMLGAILTIIRKWISMLSPENTFRDNCKFLLY